MTIRLDLLEIIGRGYIIQHCVASLNNKAKDRAYRMYVTDALKIIAENTAHALKGGGITLTDRFIDIITPKKPEEERTEEDIISEIKDKLRKLK